MSLIKIPKPFAKIAIIIGLLIITVAIIVTSIKLWQHLHQSAPTKTSTAWPYQAAQTCPASFPMPPRGNQDAYWKIYPKDTSSNPAAIAKLFPSEVGDLYGAHDKNSSNQAAVDIQCATSTQSLDQLTQSYRQALQQTNPNQTSFQQQTTTKWNHPTAILSLPNTDPKLPDTTVYLVATGHHTYLIQAVTVANAPATVINDTARILDQLKLDK